MECCKEPNFAGPDDEDEKKCLAAQSASYEPNGILWEVICVGTDKCVSIRTVFLTFKNRVGKLIMVRILRETKSAFKSSICWKHQKKKCVIWYCDIEF